VHEPAADPPLILDPRPILPLQRLGAVIEVALCSGFPTQVLLIVVLQGFGMKPIGSDGHLSPAFVSTLSMADAALVVGLVVLFLQTRGESVSDVLFGPRPAGREIALGLALLPVVFVFVALVIVLLLLVAPSLHNVVRNPLEDMLRNRRDALVFAVVVMIAGGVREEVQRGFILHRFEQYLGGIWIGLLAHSLVFGLGHFEQGYDAMIATGLLGVIWGVVYILRRSIVAPMVSHAGFNLAQLLKYFAFGR